jgi:hypothetical protein
MSKNGLATGLTTPATLRPTIGFPLLLISLQILAPVAQSRAYPATTNSKSSDA